MLLGAGCRYFVCFGRLAEVVHDRIDDVIVEEEYGGVTTTYHDDESEQDVAEFFNVIRSEMKGGLVLIRDELKWNALF